MYLSQKMKLELDNLVISLAEKLSNIEYVEEVLALDGADYKPYSVAVAYPALCILFSELNHSFPEYNFDECAHRYLERVNNYLCNNNINDISLFDGLCGIGFAANCMSNNGKYYQSFLKNLNENILNIADRSVLNLSKLPLNETIYDVMYGLTGTANYLLNFRSESRVKNTLSNILRYLVEISQISIDGVPKFSIRVDQSQMVSLSKFNDSKMRYVNLGVSHGIPGILLILCKSYKLGIYVENQLEAIKCLSEYIFNSCIKNTDTVFWESQKIIGIENNKAVPARDAWCYGTPGVAYSLLIAASILNDERLKNLAIDSMKTSLNRLREVISPTFCHGLSGLCCLSRKFYEYTNDNYFYEMYINLLKNILDLYSDKHPFGFINKELEKGEITNKNEIGLLMGSTGVILTILSCYSPIKTQWDSIFLL